MRAEIIKGERVKERGFEGRKEERRNKMMRNRKENGGEKAEWRDLGREVMEEEGEEGREGTGRREGRRCGGCRRGSW